MSGITRPAPDIYNGDGEGAEDSTLEVLGLPSSSKFGFTWPSDTPTTNLPPDLAPLFSSSEGETTDSSEVEIPPPPSGRSTSDHPTEESSSSTPNWAKTQAGPGSPPPRFSRAFSMPLPSQLRRLQHPHRNPSSPHTPTSPIVSGSPGPAHFHELSLELADSVQMIVQTLLQVSPPQILDPAKEQFSSCSLSIPTPSMSAVFSSMKNLNYLSATLEAFCSDNPGGATPILNSLVEPTFGEDSDFDVGEMLQSVGDVLSGTASQAGVDLVLFHGDVGIKHVMVKGDESAISLALSYVSKSTSRNPRAHP